MTWGFMRFSLRWKIFLGYAMPIALMVAMAASQRQSLDESVATTQWVVATNQAIAAANELVKTMADAQAGERGFVLTASASFLELYDGAMNSFGQTAGELRELVSANPGQAGRVEQISAIFLSWKAQVADPLIRSVGSADAQSQKEQAIAGKVLLDDARRIANALIASERALLAKRMAANESAVKWDRTTSVLFPLVALALTLVIGLYLSIRIGSVVTELAETASSVAGGNLEKRMRVQGDDELGRLAASFNTMADRLIERSRDTLLLKDLGEELQSCLKLDEAYAAFRRFALRALATTSGAAYVINRSRNLLPKMLSWGDEETADNFTAEQCLALRRGRTHYVEAEGAFCIHVRTPCRASLCIPLVAQGESVGVLHLFADEAILTEPRRRFAETAGEQLALAVANLQLREKLEWQSVRDTLTGLFNRRYLEETLARELIRAERNGENVGAIVFDVDYFKRFNDTFGHDAGDVVLREIGGLAGKSFRGGDVACRHGGEEFVVLVFGVTLERLVERAERLREAVRNLSLTHRGLVLGTTTISVGVSMYPLHAATGDALLRAADRALYAAKSEGRDRVRVADPQARSSSMFSQAPTTGKGV